MENFFTRYRNETVLFGILFVQIIALAVQVRVPQAPLGSATSAVQPSQPAPRLIRVWATALISPFQKMSVHSGEGVRGLWHNYVDLIHVRQENAEMKQQIDRLRLEQIRLQQDAEQGKRLQSLLGFREQYLDTTVAAQVIGTSGTDLSRVIYIDRGSHDGIEAGMAVITPDGIVGKVSRADRSTSQVLLITDPLSGAGVLLERLRLNGVLKGTQGGYPEILNVMADEKVQPGDTIITTGGDRVFPKGLPVGTVTNVFPDRDRDPFLAIRVKPAVNLGRLEEVLVVTRVLEQQLVTDSTNGPVRAADVLAARLPSAKKKSAEDVAKEEAKAGTGGGESVPEQPGDLAPKPTVQPSTALANAANAQLQTKPASKPTDAKQTPPKQSEAAAKKTEPKTDATKPKEIPH